ncbi:MAG: N-6 DNA methylase [Proteobacteria bacterium]|nr:N-6 DNA methylase [Pseudomonadota bacterium]
MYKYNLSASEELSDHFVDIQLVDDFHYIKIGATNVGQLEKAGILPKRSWGKLAGNKPDGLILSGKNNIKAIIEAKPPVGQIHSKDSAKSVITEWYYKLAKKLDCHVIIATDNSGGNTYWFDNDGQEIKEGRKSVRHSVNVTNTTSPEEKGDIVTLIRKCDNLDNGGNITPEIILNPKNLAHRVWQKIWIATNKEPEKCLYNVVEIFIFKFLSDIGVLRKDFDLDFAYVYSLSKKDTRQALDFYAKNVRSKIKDEMFPKGDDGTTIFNGTIFVNESGKAIVGQAGLFAQILEEFAKYDREFGSFKNIDRSFKTRLYEDFLRQSASVAALGQYFTPRNVILAIMDMINPDSVKADVRMCDPFCGVGGFPLEFINKFENIFNQFRPKNREIKLSAEITGYDKGSDEKDDERTIILAKANMLIYLADILKDNGDLTEEFSKKVFNKTFHLIKDDILGTFGMDDKEDYYDFILTNPPYVTSGIATIKKEIADRGLLKIYPSNGNGLEGLAVEWIIRALKPRGKAFVIVPDGLLSRSADKTLRNKILDTCEVNAVVSLPSRTFFATPKRTYILAITKKDKGNKSEQTLPIFTYLVSEIGETKDTKRFEEPGKNDLVNMSVLFSQFSARPEKFLSSDPRCKLQNIDRLRNNNWLVDKDWTVEEKKDLGIEDDVVEISVVDFYDLLNTARNSLADILKQDVPRLGSDMGNDGVKYKEIALNSVGKFIKGNSRFTAKYCREHSGGYPVLSAATTRKDYIGRIDTYDFDTECITITTNGHYAGTVSYLEKQRFSVNGDAGVFILDNPDISYRYLAFVLKDIRNIYGFGWENKPTKGVIENMMIPIPIKSDGSFDLQKQMKVADRYESLESKKSKVIEMMEKIKNVQIKINLAGDK